MVTKRIVLHFPQRLVEEPIVYRLIKDYNLIMNIMKASVTPKEEGLMVVELKGEKADYEQGIQYLKDSGVIVDPLSKDIKRNDLRCTHCGACVAVCPASALTVDKKTKHVKFDDAKCIACELCVQACPVDAMEMDF